MILCNENVTVIRGLKC